MNWLRAVLVAALIGAGWYAKGVLEERDTLRQTVTDQQETLKLASKVTTVTSSVLSDRVQSAASIQKKAKDVQVEIQKRIPADAACSLSGDWRLLHDTAASNAEVPAAPSGADAQTVTPQEAASTVAGNYALCHDTADRLGKLQSWIEGISE